LAVRQPISEALAHDALEPFGGAGGIVEAVGGAGVVAELELGKVAVQVVIM
jgi:hypothetical protein